MSEQERDDACARIARITEEYEARCDAALRARKPHAYDEPPDMDAYNRAWGRAWSRIRPRPSMFIIADTPLTSRPWGFEFQGPQSVLQWRPPMAAPATKQPLAERIAGIFDGYFAQRTLLDGLTTLDLARRAIEIADAQPCDRKTAAETRLVERLLSFEASERRGKHGIITWEDVRDSAAAVRAERAPQPAPRFIVWESGWRDTFTGVNFNSNSSGFSFTHGQRESLLAALNAAHDRGEIP